MYTKRIYTAKQMALWTRYETLFFFILIVGTVALYQYVDLDWLRVPWTPLALIGTAVAIVIGFQNNSAYGRIWEARKIWGGIVNTSRTFGMFVQDMVTNAHMKEKLPEEEILAEIKKLTHRHIAWMTALRHAMRASRTWETVSQLKTNREWNLNPPERLTSLHDDLILYLSDEDFEYLETKDNKQTALLYLQSHHLRKLKEKGLIWEFAFLELERTLKDLFDLQGKSERIKNFPYPRHFATLNHFFMWVLLLLLPLALVPQFAEIAQDIAGNYPLIAKYFTWLTVPFYVIVSWVFHTMERIGRTGENPFEGTANDVPISTIARGIEIDMRQNLGETKEQIPGQFPMLRKVQF